MAKAKTVHICQNCSFKSSQWVGQCPDCGEWNTLVEEIINPVDSSQAVGARHGVRPPVKLSKVKKAEIKRISSGSKEFDRVLGGGFVPGQVILLAGDPGVGKSTLLTQIAKNVSPKMDVLYVCGEESVSQVKVRAERMKYKGTNLLAVAETDVDTINSTMELEQNASLFVVDSIQSLTSREFTGFAGSIGQIRGGAQKLATTAKRTGKPLILVGHVTKDGAVAGPKVLEHIVDTVLYLEGDSQHLYRILRTNKNRFGPVSEVGIYEMTEDAMVDVQNPSEMFLSSASKAPGSCVTVVMEGFRPILFEIQALTTKTSFGYPVRTASGFSANRLKVLIAILEKRCGLNLGDQDVYVNVAGGFKINEYAADLAVCLAIASSARGKPLKSKTAVIGEVGLLGEVRRISHEDKRIKEARKLGYTNVMSPQKFRSVEEVLNTAL